MNKDEYYTRLGKALDFVENNLDKKISLTSVSEHAFSSLSHFHRIFYFMTGMTIKDYIRRRRLSEAAKLLITTNKSIIDIALDAQFDTPESFNKSFKKLFLFSPSEFRKNKPEFSVMRKLELHPENRLKQPENISLNFIYLQQQYVAGLKTRTTLEDRQQTKDIPQFFGEVMKNSLLANITGVLDRQKLFGVYSDMSDEEEFDFTVGLLVEKPTGQTKYVTHVLPATEYARFTVQGDPSGLEDAWRYIYGSWMPVSGRDRQKGLDFEIYYPDKTDIYIPLISEKHDTK